jgi:cytochrome c oxidase cbb3-type subunit III
VRANPLIAFIALGSIGAGIALGGCERERRDLREPPTADLRRAPVRVSALQPGPPQPADQALGPYDENAYGISEGQRLFDWYNCTGCHFHGGGGIGPALMDDQWIYGSAPANIYSTIAEGRPNGMPSFGGKIPPNQIWQLVAYVRSLAGLTPKTANPARDDHLATTPQPTSVSSQPPPKTQKAEHPG